MAKPSSWPPPCSAKKAKPGQDFFPLTVNYHRKDLRRRQDPRRLLQARRPSVGKGNPGFPPDRPSDPPLFVKGFKNEVQVVCTVLQHDLENDPDIVAMVAASAALTISGVPFMGPIGGARVGYVNGEYVLNPTLDELKESEIDLVVAGTADAVMMVESEAKELSEEIVLGCRHVRPQVDSSRDRRASSNWPNTPPRSPSTSSRTTPTP
jgi:polyribonucleotide nucleotidyltransferase